MSGVKVNIKEATFRDGDMVMIDRSACDSPTALFRCSGGGFGSEPNSGGKMYGTFVSSGTDSYARRCWVTGWATEGDIREAQNWAAKPDHIIKARMCDNRTSRMSREVDELCNDESSRVTKDQLRLAMLSLHVTLQNGNDTLQEVVNDRH